MFIKLLPEQIVKVWDMLRFAIAETFIPAKQCTVEHLRFMLARLLAGTAQCWAAYKREEGYNKFIGFIITRIIKDESNDKRILFIDCVYAWQTPSEEIIYQSWPVLNEFAKRNNCSIVQSYTEQDRIATLAERLGFTKLYVVSKEVE